MPQNFPESARLRKEAASRGHMQAQADLGRMYSEGKGVEKDLRQAYYWLAVAAQQGDDTATNDLKRISESMTGEQIREADTQAREWMDKTKRVPK